MANGIDKAAAFSSVVIMLQPVLAVGAEKLQQRIEYAEIRIARSLSLRSSRCIVPNMALKRRDR
jgi:hypothetical protein